MVVTLKANTLGGGGGSGSGDGHEILPYKGTVSSVPQDALTTLVSHTVSLGFSFKLLGVIATGTVAAEYIVFDDATELYRARTSPDDRTFDFTHNPISIASGHTITLKVVWNDFVSGTQNFEGSLLGYDI